MSTQSKESGHIAYQKDPADAKKKIKIPSAKIFKYRDDLLYGANDSEPGSAGHLNGFKRGNNGAAELDQQSIWMS